MTLREACQDLADAFNTQKVWIRNKVTNVVLDGPAGTVTPDQIFNWSSHGELFHIAEWHAVMYPKGPFAKMFEVQE